MADIVFLSLITLVLIFLLLYVKFYTKNESKSKDSMPSMEDISPDDPYAVAKERYIHARSIIEKNKKLIPKDDLRDLKFLAEINPNGQLLMQKEYDIFFRKFEEIKDKVNAEQLKKLRENGELPDNISEERLLQLIQKDNDFHESLFPEEINHSNDSLDDIKNINNEEIEKNIANK